METYRKNEDEVLQEALKLIVPDYKKDFIKFVQTGDGSEELRQYLDNDKQAQEATEIMCEFQIGKLVELRDNFYKYFDNLSDQEKKNIERKFLEGTSLSYKVKHFFKNVYRSIRGN